MKIVCIKGGLGNQMFQYAFAFALKKHFPEENVFIDTSFYRGYSFRHFELDKLFNLSLPKASLWNILKVYYPQYNYKLWRALCHFFPYRKTYYKEDKMFSYYNEVFQIGSDVYFYGSWQNELYFKNYRNELLREFCIKAPLRYPNQQLMKKIEETNSVSIHVRRGDFLLYSAYNGICEAEYYKAAIDFINNHVSSPHYFIFSDDEEWCFHHIAPLCLESYSLINWNNGNNSYEDMMLMSRCKHNIIAHSSFSWWAAWLNIHEDKVVVAPQKWINSDKVTDSPQLDSWVLIDG